MSRAAQSRVTRHARRPLPRGFVDFLTSKIRASAAKAPRCFAGEDAGHGFFRSDRRQLRMRREEGFAG